MSSSDLNDASSSSDEEDYFFGRMESDDLFKETDVQQAKRREADRYVKQYAERDWGLAARQRCVQGADKDVVTENVLELRTDRKIVFKEKQGQQAKVWDCALVLAKFLANDTYFPHDFFTNKRVIELGCGIGVPGLAAAALGAKEVILTDMPMAIPWIQANIEQNQMLGLIAGNVVAQGLMWGKQEALALQHFDIILCSDLVYGQRDISLMLVQTIVQLAHPNTLVIVAHEARFAGDRGHSFFALLCKHHFQVDQVPREHLDVSSSALAPFPVISRQSLWQNVYNLDMTQCHDPLLNEGDLQIMLDVITKDEELLVADECSRILKRRRYEENHWDNAIVKFKEMERSRWSTETLRVLQKVREATILPKELNYFPAVHVIELAEDGYIKPHLDSIKFSGRVVAGVNLLSPSVMRFKEEYGDSVIDAYLPRRSMYMMTGRVRYHYTHEIVPGMQVFKGQVPVNRTHRISILLRDEFLEEHIAKYYTPYAKVDVKTE
ncbi:hypothetical protein DD238_003602 [Peronospora effusa]|uniref:Alpha-ketoglutarate-dependent dioxygenase AlkB-like domain-containing protein n=1 Tax=Peronospora effusa TaxID=542832 RepID=A0A3M6V6P9_9STRA|nr:hypothetical protein DD238_003602 [Peronospora effusa]